MLCIYCRQTLALLLAARVAFAVDCYQNCFKPGKSLDPGAGVDPNLFLHPAYHRWVTTFLAFITIQCLIVAKLSSSGVIFRLPVVNAYTHRTALQLSFPVRSLLYQPHSTHKRS